MNSNPQKALELAVQLFLSPINPFPGDVEKNKNEWKERDSDGLLLIADELLRYLDSKQEKYDYYKSIRANMINSSLEPTSDATP